MLRLGFVTMLTAALTASLAAPTFAADAAPTPWPAPVPGFVPPKPGEHPRLFFRTSDLPALKARANTPEGKAILARLTFLLKGKPDAKGPDGATAHVTAHNLAGQSVLVMTLQKGPAPERKVDGSKLTVGGQTLTVEAGKLTAAK